MLDLDGRDRVMNINLAFFMLKKRKKEAVVMLCLDHHCIVSFCFIAWTQCLCFLFSLSLSESSVSLIWFWTRSM